MRIKFKMVIINYFLFTVIFPLFSKAQNGENIYLSVKYKLVAFYKEKQTVNDSCVLNMSKSYSYFYSLGKKAADEKSLKEFEKTQEFSNKFTCKDCFPYVFFKEYTKNRVYRVQPLMGVYYAFEQPSTNNINWILTKDSLTVNGINCFKAVGKIDTVTYTVFYAPTIPISDGPSILAGLPGLIVKSESSAGLKIEITSLEYLNQLSEENKYSSNFQFTTYQKFKAAEIAMKETLESGKEVQMSNGATIKRVN